MEKRENIDLSGIVVAAILIVVAVIALWETTHMVDSDSFIFPRAVAIAMIGFSGLFIVLQLFTPSVGGSNDEAGLMGGSYLRRAGVVIAMIVSALLMPWLGFLISGVLAFISIMLLAMYDKWTPKLRLVFPLVGVMIVIGFYYVFAKLLLVPLPAGTLFE